VVSLIERMARKFIVPGAVDTSWQYYGANTEEYAPAEYGEYVAISNGVYVCVNRRAEYASSVPLKLYKVSRAGRKEVEIGDLRAVIDKVNPYWTFNRLMQMTEQSLCLWGVNFWALDRGNSGRMPPRAIWWMRPDRVNVYPSVDNYIDRFGYEPISGGPEQFFQPSEIFWLRKPNPIDEFAGLSPLAAARLAADTANSAQKANNNLFRQGVQLGGIISPKAGQPMLTQEQGEQLQNQFNRKFTGSENAHRWAVMKLDMQFQSMQMTPKDAEYLGALNWSLEEICRAYGVPLDLVGGQRTYANAKEARYAMWEDTMVPELRFIATELTEQLLPMFPGQADIAEFDTSTVEVLQESTDEKHARARENFKVGGMTVNRFMEIIGEEPLKDDQGNVLMVPSTVTFLRPEDLTAKAEMAMTPPPDPNALNDPNEDPTDDKPAAVPANGAKSLTAGQTRAIEFGSAEHERVWRAFTKQSDKHERTVTDTVTRLFQNQRKSILAKLNAPERALRVADMNDPEFPFDRAAWIRKFREAIRPVLVTIVADVGIEALDSLGVGLAFNVKSPDAIRFLEGRAQRFAVRVNDTTWNALKASLSEGINAGEAIPDLAKRVESIMGDRIRSSSEVIARTETIGALNGGTQLAWEQSGVVAGKEWLSALDERTRETHLSAHGQRVRLNEDFTVGGGSGPQPGAIGIASEDVNCRCSMVAVLDVDWVDQ
jgi:HK97 family phage portal protein